MSITNQQVFNWENVLSQDECAKLAKSRENESISDYVMFNFFDMGDCEGKMKELQSVASEHPNLRFRNGYGVASSCVIDRDSEVRNNVDLTHGPEKQQLYVRNFHAVPDFSRGVCAPNTESLLINGLDTSHDRVCNRLMERDFNRFTPYTECFARFIEQGQINIPAMQTIGENSVDLVRRKFQTQCSR
jgi:hypothetical protein